MIYYCTKNTLERYNIKCSSEFHGELKDLQEEIIISEKGNSYYEWGVKLFYFCGKKCLLVMHFKSKLTTFLCDIKIKDMSSVPNMVACYLFNLYENDKPMKTALEKFFASSPLVVFDKITDKSAIASLNHMLSCFAFDGYRLYDFISDDGILQTLKFNRASAEYLVTVTIDGKKEYITPLDYFRELIVKKFG